jgi:dihydroorotate dehydrogenase (NAD+) catalytic subunit
MNQLWTSIGTITLRNPIILAAGILGSTYSTLNRLFHEGFGAVTTKSLGLKPRIGHPNPSVIYLPEINSVVNAVGLANPGIEYFSREFHRIDPDVKYVVSCFGSDPEEFVKVVRVIDNETKDCTKPVAIELNLSCPHAQKVGIAIGTDPVIVEDVVKSVKKSTSLPVWAKLTPNITDITKIGIAAVNGGVDALVACNTIKALIIDISTKKPILANKRGGLSGSAIKPIAIRAIYDLYELLESEVSLIGVGGITTWEDIIEYVLAGANAVQIGTTLSYTNPKDLINSFVFNLNTYLEQENNSLNELRGLAHE